MHLTAVFKNVMTRYATYTAANYRTTQRTITFTSAELMRSCLRSLHCRFPPLPCGRKCVLGHTRTTVSLSLRMTLYADITVQTDRNQAD